MRQLVLMRGAPGAGKSTFIHTHDLEPYTLAADGIRMQFQGPTYGIDGMQHTPQDNDKQVWSFLLARLEDRMARGEFIVIDAMHAHPSAFKNYRELAERYRYRVTAVDFSHIPIEVAKINNAMREDFKIVPESVIDKAYLNMRQNRVPEWIEVMQPEMFTRERLGLKPTDYSHYKRVHFIGDLQGCYAVLKDYLRAQDVANFPEDELFIFVGDLVDRGSENGDVVNLMLRIMNRPNVLILEGNHETHLGNWAFDRPVTSKEFRNRTEPQLRAAGVPKKEVKNLIRKLKQCVWMRYHDVSVMVTHAGLSSMPDNPMLVHADQMTRALGSRHQDNIDAAWMASTDGDDTLFQVHGHRNSHFPDRKVGINEYERSINLEENVEFGGFLRVATLDQKGWKFHRVQNHVFFYDRYVPEEQVFAEKKVPQAPKTMLERLRAVPTLVNEKPQKGTNISSFNFARKVFYDRAWDANEMVTKARGLFINTVTEEVVARSYNKFFNIEERPETQMRNLRNNLRFPVTVYQKDNGFLGITGHDSETDSLIVASKSTITGPFAENFREQLDRDVKNMGYFKACLAVENMSAVFEVIDPVFDPHIVEYDRPRLVMLDLIRRTEKFERIPYEQMVGFATSLGVDWKKRTRILATWREFEDWYKSVMENDPKLEGYVIEDSSGFMTKIKLPWYSLWKRRRALAGKVAKDPAATIAVLAEDNLFYAWLKERPGIAGLDIITLRKQFEQEVHAHAH